MQDDSDIRIKRQWETSPFRRNTPCADPEKECDAFCKAFCDAFCNEFCCEFLEDNLRDDRSGERAGENIGGIGDDRGGIGDNIGGIGDDRGGKGDNLGGIGDDRKGVPGGEPDGIGLGPDSINIMSAGNNRLETCRERCCRICRKVCRRAYWEVIGKGPMA